MNGVPYKIVFWGKEFQQMTIRKVSIYFQIKNKLETVLFLFESVDKRLFYVL